MSETASLSDSLACADYSRGQKLSLLEKILLYLLSVLLVVLMFGKEGFLLTEGSMSSGIAWFATSAWALSAKYTAIPLGISVIAIKAACCPKQNIFGNLTAGLGPWFLFGMYIAVGTIVTTAPEYAEWHKQAMAGGTLPAFTIILAILLFGRPGIIILRNMILVYACALAVMVLVTRGGVIGAALSNVKMSERYAAGFVIFAAKTLYYCAFSLIFAAFTLKYKRRTPHILLLIGAFVLMFAGFSTGARGPLVAAVVSILVWLVFMRAKLSTKLLTASLLVCVLIVGWILVDRYAPEASSHLRSTDDSGREQYAYSVVLRSTPTLFGRGTGSFALVSPLIYPHNLFLEVYYEHGILGLFMLLALFTTLFWRLLLATQRHRGMLSLWIFVSMIYFFVCAQFSGATAEHIGLWVFALIGSRYLVMADSRANVTIRIPRLRRLDEYMPADKRSKDVG